MTLSTLQQQLPADVLLRVLPQQVTWLLEVMEAARPESPVPLFLSADGTGEVPSSVLHLTSPPGHSNTPPDTAVVILPVTPRARESPSSASAWGQPPGQQNNEICRRNTLKEVGGRRPSQLAVAIEIYDQVFKVSVTTELKISYLITHLKKL